MWAFFSVVARLSSPFILLVDFEAFANTRGFDVKCDSLLQIDLVLVEGV